MTGSSRPPFIQLPDGSVTTGRVVPPQSDVLGPVVGHEMTFVRVDHQTRLQFNHFEIAIGSPFHLTTAGGGEFALDPRLRVGLGPLLELYPDVLEAATVDKDSSLRLRLAGGATIDVPADDQFEAWEVHGPDGFLVVCMPGGQGLAVWNVLSA